MVDIYKEQPLPKENEVSKTIFETQWLPNKPLASNDLTYGLKRQTRVKALDMRWVETSPSTLKNIMVFDIDKDEAAWKVKTACYDNNSIPEPNWITTNPATGHAHIGYVLDAPVGTERGSLYFKAVYEGLREAVGGDKAYGGRITRNPLLQPSEWLTERQYTLKELQAYSKPLTVRSLKEDVQINGRNDQLFHSLRTYAYNAYLRLKFNKEALLKELEGKGLELNLSDFTDPLSTSEVLQVVKSIHKWTVTHFTPQRLSDIQRKRSLLRWEPTASERNANINLIFFLKEQGLSFLEISENLGIPKASVKTLYYRNKG